MTLNQIKRLSLAIVLLLTMGFSPNAFSITWFGNMFYAPEKQYVSQEDLYTIRNMYRDLLALDFPLYHFSFDGEPSPMDLDEVAKVWSARSADLVVVKEVDEGETEYRVYQSQAHAVDLKATELRCDSLMMSMFKLRAQEGPPTDKMLLGTFILYMSKTVSDLIGKLKDDERIKLSNLNWDAEDLEEQVNAGLEENFSSNEAMVDLPCSLEAFSTNKSPILPDFEILKMLKTFPTDFSEGSLNQYTQKYDFPDSKKTKAVRRLSEVIFKQPSVVKSAFQKLSAEEKLKFQRNSRGLSMSSRLEPFDVLLSSIANLVLSSESSMGFPDGLSEKTNSSTGIMINRVVQRGLFELFDMTAAQDPQAATLNPFAVNERDGVVTLVCANYDTEIVRRNYFFNSLRIIKENTVFGSPNFVTTVKFSQKDLSNAKNQFIKCGTRQLHVDINMLRGFEIPTPKPLDLSSKDIQSPIEALVSVSIVESIENGAREMALGFLSQLGYKPVGQSRIVKTKDEVANQIPKVDIYVPAAHAMDINSLDIGTTSSEQIYLEKVIKDKKGQNRKIRLNVLLPTKSKDEFGDDVVDIVEPPSRQELAGWLLARRLKQNPSSLVIVNASCGSAKTLPQWSLAYRESLKRNGADPASNEVLTLTDFPYSFGSRTNFSTSTSEQLIANFPYPLIAIEMLASGDRVEDIKDMLSKPVDLSKIQGITPFGLAMQETLYGGDKPSFNFEPVYSGDYPDLRKYQGYAVELYDYQTKQRLKYESLGGAADL